MRPGLVPFGQAAAGAVHDGDGHAERRADLRVLDRGEEGCQALGEVMDRDRARSHHPHPAERLALGLVADQIAILLDVNSNGRRLSELLVLAAFTVWSVRVLMRMRMACIRVIVIMRVLLATSVASAAPAVVAARRRGRGCALRSHGRRLRLGDMRQLSMGGAYFIMVHPAS